MSKKCDNISIRFDTVLVLEDRHTDNIVLCMHRHAVCDKNERTSSKLYDDVYAQLINAFWSNHGFPLNLANDPSVTFHLKRGTVYPSN